LFGCANSRWHDSRVTTNIVAQADHTLSGKAFFDVFDFILPVVL